MDELDQQIVGILEIDGRASFAKIGKQIGLTSAAVGQRVQKLIEEGVILGFSVKTEKAKMGIQIQAMVSVKLNFTKIDSFYKILTAYPEVEQCYRVTGDECIIMKVNLRDNAHLLDFINRVSAYGFPKSSIIIEKLV
ncbi:MAG: Lrp/AsnC family transcriptional regulator [Bacteroidota bacterium]